MARHAALARQSLCSFRGFPSIGKRRRWSGFTGRILQRPV